LKKEGWDGFPVISLNPPHPPLLPAGEKDEIPL